ncbi:transposase, partial [Ferrimicrobium acidiphilum]|uniref:transposase n=1 Tax=Ferrimicrobium acidiphilum TaxID=121039 RepID=UPI001B8071C3
IDEVNEMLDHWCKRASRSRLSSFIRLSKTIRTHRDGILASVILGVSNGRVEGLNTKVRSIIARSYGFHSAKATLALVMLACGPIDLKLPYERASLSTWMSIEPTIPLAAVRAQPSHPGVMVTVRRSV